MPCLDSSVETQSPEAWGRLWSSAQLSSVVMRVVELVPRQQAGLVGMNGDPTERLPEASLEELVQLAP